MMSNGEKVDRAIELIRKAGYKNEITNPEEIYQVFREMELFEIAEEISGFLNLIYGLRDILEGEQ